MALVKGTNSYATVAEAETYFTDRLDVSAWEVASDSQKEQALVTATSILDDLSWTGIAVSESQLLAFPRIGTYFDPRIGVNISMETVPVRILRAVYELAYHLLNNDGLFDDVGGLDSLKIGTFELKTIKSANKIPDIVRRIIKPLLLNAGASTWWRAN